MPAVTLTGIALLGAGDAWSQDASPPRVMFQSPQPTVVTSGSGNLNRYPETSTTSFPATSSVPLVWRAKRSTVDQASATESIRENSQSSAKQPLDSQATMMVDGQVRPVAFTLQLGNEQPPVNNKPRIRQVSGPVQSVLTTPVRKPEEQAKAAPPTNNTDPFKDPFGDRMPTPAKIDLRTVQQGVGQNDGDSFVPPTNPLQNAVPQQPACQN